MQNKIVLVTGGTSGIGEACVRKFSASNAQVIFCGRTKDTGNILENNLRKKGNGCVFYQADVSKAKGVSSLFKFIQQNFGKLDIAINNAGIVGERRKPFHRFSTIAWRNVIDNNLLSCFLCMKQEIKLMLKNSTEKGAIINVSSIAGVKAGNISAAYTASKHAVIGLTRAAAREYALKNIRINAVCPAFIDTNMVDCNLIKTIGSIKQHIPLGRLGTPEEIANAIFWLCSEESSFITGTATLIDGGITA